MPRSLLLCICLGTLVWASCGRRPAAPLDDCSGQPCNVVVVMLDTVRPDHLEFFGYERRTAPFLTELAERSVVFERAVSPSSWTAPATASLFNGLYPPRHGVVMGMGVFKKRQNQRREEGLPTITLNRLPDDLPTLPELFQRAGFRTYGIASNRNISNEIGFDRGFDRFFRYRFDAEELYSHLLEWEEEIRNGGRYLLYLHFNDAHSPYSTHLPWFAEDRDTTRALVRAYDSEISYMDRVLRRVYERFDVGESAVMVVVSDHGEGLDEQHRGRSHGRNLHWQTNDILMTWAGPPLRNARVRQRASLVDVVPTLLDLSGRPVPAGLDGQSLAPLLIGGESPARAEAEARFDERTVFAHLARINPPLWVAMRGPWKLIARGETMQLYNRDEDPGETKNLVRENRDQAAALLSEIRAYRERAVDLESRVSVDVQLDRETYDELRTLGYVE